MNLRLIFSFLVWMAPFGIWHTLSFVRNSPILISMIKYPTKSNHTCVKWHLVGIIDIRVVIFHQNSSSFDYFRGPATQKLRFLCCFLLNFDRILTLLQAIKIGTPLITSNSHTLCYSGLVQWPLSWLDWVGFQDLFWQVMIILLCLPLILVSHCLINTSFCYMDILNQIWILIGYL